MDKQIFKERILETENLTDELEDSDADWLLNWGINMLDQVLFDVVTEETAGENVNALMAVMRQINRICEWRKSKSVTELALELSELSDLLKNGLKQVSLANSIECEEAAVRLIGIQTTAQALQFLTSLRSSNANQ